MPYRVKIMGDELSVFSKSKAALDSDFCRQGSVLIEPSMDCDFSLKVFNDGKKVQANAYSSAASAADFLMLFRGIPLDEITFSFNKKVITVCSQKSTEYSVEMPKCKFKFTQTLDFFGAHIPLFFTEDDKEMLFLEVANISDFDLTVAPTILMKQLGLGAGSLTVFSRSGSTCLAKSIVSHLEHPPHRLDIAVYLSAFLGFCSNAFKKLILDGKEAELSYSGSAGILTFHSETDRQNRQ